RTAGRAPTDLCRAAPSRAGPRGRDDDFVFPVELGDEHIDAATTWHRHFLADDVGVNGQFAATAIDENGERNARGPAEVAELIERCADRSARVEHVVDDHDVLALERPW